MELSDFIEPRGSEHLWITPAAESPGPQWDRTISHSDLDLTFAEFVENVFVPEHVAAKKTSGRVHYRAILKYVLRPEEVDRIFKADTSARNRKLRAIDDWPYLSDLRLSETRRDDVQRLISAAVQRGYSAQTVTHMRNVISAVYAHAKRRRWFLGDNPATPVSLPEMTRKKAHALTLAQVNELLTAMKSPEREMAILTVLTGMKMGDVCRLQWRHVNFTDKWYSAGAQPIPPQTIVIKTQPSRSELDVKWKVRERNLPIPASLVRLLRELSARERFDGPDDFVFVSRSGKPIRFRDVAQNRLKPIGKCLGMPWLSWQVLRRTHRALAYEYGRNFQQLLPVLQSF